MLLKPVQAKLSVVIKIIFSKEAIYELECSLDTHRATVSFQYGSILGKDRHTGTNDRLRQIHRRNRGAVVTSASSHLFKGCWQNFIYLTEEGASRDSQGVCVTLTAD